MKKALIITLTIMLALSLAGCKKAKTTENPETTTNPEVTDVTDTSDDASGDYKNYTFHDITFDLPEDAVGNEVDEDHFNLVVDGDMIQFTYEKTDKEMTDGVKSVTSQVESMGATDVEAKEETINGILMGTATCTIGENEIKAYMFTSGGGVYYVDATDEDALDELMATVRPVEKVE